MKHGFAGTYKHCIMFCSHSPKSNSQASHLETELKFSKQRSSAKFHPLLIKMHFKCREYFSNFLSLRLQSALFFHFRPWFLELWKNLFVLNDFAFILSYFCRTCFQILCHMCAFHFFCAIWASFLTNRSWHIFKCPVHRHLLITAWNTIISFASINTSEIKWNHDQLRCKYKQAVRFNTCLLSQNLPNWTKTRTSKTSYRSKKQLILHFSDQFQNKLSSTLPVKKQIFDLSENSNKAQYWVGPTLLWIQWNITFALLQWITKIVIKIMKFVNGW